MATNSGRGTKLWIVLMKLGACTGCHQLYRRSFHLRGYQFPVCARCFGLAAGQLAGLLVSLLCPGIVALSPLLLALAGLSLAALGIDGLGQLHGRWISTNPRRLITGLLCGFFVVCVLVRAVAYVLQLWF